MCGVVAYVGEPLSENGAKGVRSVLLESRVRGLHAAGVAVVDGASIAVSKALDVNQAILAIKPGLRVVLCHTRYSTSGDWREPRNNQPLEIDGAVLVFNGCIDMGPRSEWEERDGRAYTTDNDGELFLRHVLEGRDWDRFVSFGSFSFAGAFAFNGEVWALRNARRPLWFVPFEGGTLVASTRDILKRAGINYSRAKEVPPCTPLRLL